MHLGIAADFSIIRAYYAANANSTLNNTAVGKGRINERALAVFASFVSTNHAADVSRAGNIARIDENGIFNFAAVGIENTAGAVFLVSRNISKFTNNVAGIGGFYISDSAFVIAEDTACAAVDRFYGTAVINAELRFCIADSNRIFTRYAADIVIAGNFTLIINGLQIANITVIFTVKAHDAADIFSSFGRQFAFVGSVIDGAVVSACNAAEVLSFFVTFSIGMQSNLALYIFNSAIVSASYAADIGYAVNTALILQVGCCRIDIAVVHACHAADIGFTVNRSAAVVRHVLEFGIFSVSANHTADVGFAADSARVARIADIGILAVAHYTAGVARCGQIISGCIFNAG